MLILSTIILCSLYLVFIIPEKRTPWSTSCVVSINDTEPVSNFFLFWSLFNYRLCFPIFLIFFFFFFTTICFFSFLAIVVFFRIRRTVRRSSTPLGRLILSQNTVFFFLLNCVIFYVQRFILSFYSFLFFSLFCFLLHPVYLVWGSICTSVYDEVLCSVTVMNGRACIGEPITEGFDYLVAVTSFTSLFILSAINTRT